LDFAQPVSIQGVAVDQEQRNENPVGEREFKGDEKSYYRAATLKYAVNSLP
jgi:hypothetical protein